MHTILKFFALAFTLGLAGEVTADTLPPSAPKTPGKPTPAHKQVAKHKSNREPISGMVFISVSGGTFQMGCAPGVVGCMNEEIPSHEVRLAPFDIGQFKVTQGQWRAVMGNDPPGLFFKNCGANCPVEGISWYEIQDFMAVLNKQSGHGCRYRLPTEAEWEYSCRSGGNAELYCGGDNVDTVAWYQGNSGGTIHPVGQKVPNGLGLFDMSGNTWEWVNDWYDGGYYTYSPRDNPQGPTSGTALVIRGGSWVNGASALRATFRDGAAPERRGNGLGFRLARTCP
ncbi:MAG: formylglycine-generating enzyme family protein [Magnetococcales bacterium]|nr:formylglycine-generating enzyme family protein [Magnetococcales bacterium]